MQQRFVSGGFKTKSRRELSVRGRAASVLEFKTPDGKVDMDVLLVRKWPVIYMVSITGSETGDASWKQVADSLSESVEIR